MDKASNGGGRPGRGPRLPPRWFVLLAWYVHRGVYRITGGRVDLWRPRGNRWGTMCLTTTGRRTGRQRAVLLGYVEDGPNLVTLAMNGWGRVSRPGGSISSPVPIRP
jgi:F420H(2)-dependent quinone reductase